MSTSEWVTKYMCASSRVPSFWTVYHCVYETESYDTQGCSIRIQQINTWKYDCHRGKYTSMAT